MVTTTAANITRADMASRIFVAEKKGFAKSAMQKYQLAV